MKLLFVHQNLGDFGGAETNIHLAAGELKKRGHTVALLHLQSTSRNETGWREIFSECYLLPAPGHLETVEAVLEQFGPDVVYLHNLDDLEVVRALLDSSVPVVRMVHDHALYCMRGYKYNYFTRKICTRAASSHCVFPCLGPLTRNRGGLLPVKWNSYQEKKKEIELNQRCARLVVYSDYLKQELIGNGFGEGQIETCVPIRLAADEEPNSTLNERNLILFAGQIIRGKGVDALLEALARMKGRFECHILGEGSHRAHCEKKCARLGLSNRVRFQGYVLPAELKSYYLEASVFVMSSLWPEPFGMSGPEAMRYGLPVVAFDAGGIKEWLHDGDNGFLVPWNDTTAFAARLDELLDNKPLARQMGRCGRESLARFEAGKQIDKLEQIFRNVLEQRPFLKPGTFVSNKILTTYL
jgi:glycosyltransferase involved in cell wall biosynthesis